jgi:hypothetical protein
MGTPKVTELESGEQGYLMEIHDDKAKGVLAIGKKYLAAVQKRLAAGRKEVTLKGEIRDYIRGLEYKPLADGCVRISIEGTEICVSPQDDKITIKEKSE